MGTPGYMSPEQATGEIDQLGPATDLYALGAILYEILTNQPPLAGNLFEVLERTKQGRIPSPRQVSKGVPAALEAICLKALAREPGQRYASATALAQEVERYLADEPVTAYAEPWTLRARRWLRKHRTLAFSLGMGVVVLVLVLVPTTFLLEAARQQEQWDKQEIGKQWQRAENNATEALKAGDLARRNEADAKDKLDQTTRIKNFLLEEVLAAARAEGERGGKAWNITLREALIAAEPSIAQRFHGKPLLEAEIRHELGVTFRLRADLDRAAEQFRQAIALRQQHAGPEAQDTLNSMNSLAMVLSGQGKYAEAEKLLHTVVACRTTHLGRRHRETLYAQCNLATVLANQARNAEAEKLFRATLADQAETLGQTHGNTLLTKRGLAEVLQNLGRYAEAEKLLQEVLKAYAAGSDTDQHDIIRMGISLADAIHHQGRYAEAGELYRVMLPRLITQLGPDHPNVLALQNNLALIANHQQKYAEAETLLRAVLKAQTAKLGPTHPNTIRAQANLASVLESLDKYAEAGTLYRSALESFRSTLGPDHPNTLVTQANLALVLVRQGALVEAEREYRAVLALAKTKLGPEHHFTLLTQNNLAYLLIKTKHFDEAERLTEDTYRTLLKIKGQNLPLHRDILKNMVDLYEAWGQKDKAAEWRKKLPARSSGPKGT